VNGGAERAAGSATLSEPAGQYEADGSWCCGPAVISLFVPDGLPVPLGLGVTSPSVVAGRSALSNTELAGPETVTGTVIGLTMSCGV